MVIGSSDDFTGSDETKKVMKNQLRPRSKLLSFLARNSYLCQNCQKKHDILQIFFKSAEVLSQIMDPQIKIYPKYVLKRSSANFGKTQKKPAHSMRS